MLRSNHRRLLDQPWSSRIGLPSPTSTYANVVPSGPRNDRSAQPALIRRLLRSLACKPTGVDRFWNERMETMGSAELRELESTRLAEQMAYNHATSPFLAAKMAAAGAEPGDLQTVEDLAA